MPSSRRTTPNRIRPSLAALAACLVMTGAFGPARCEIRSLSLYEKTGRAPLVVWAEVTDAEHRFAVVRTLEVLKAVIPEKPGTTFRIAYRLDSFLRQPWQ